MIATTLLRFLVERPVNPMPSRILAAVAFTAIVCGCAQMRETQANVAGNRYLTCLNAAADKNTDNPAGAEEIAAAAHARCWAEWTRYSDEIQTDFIRQARTAEEAQLAHDKADAHLRQFEFDARQAVMSRVVQRTYGVPGAAR